MVKAAEKKPITPQELSSLRQSTISDPVRLQDIVKAADKYSKAVQEFNCKPDQLNLVKTHFAMMLNSILSLAHYERKTKELVQIDESGNDIDMELKHGLAIVRNLL